MRKLMFACIGFTLALIFSHYLFSEQMEIYFAIGAFILAFSGFFFRKNVRKAIIIVLIFASLGFGWSLAYKHFFIRPAESLVGSCQRVQARVLDYPSVNDGYSTMTVMLTGDGVPHSKVLVTDYDGGFSDLEVGDIISIDLEFRSARIRYNVEDDYYFASGIFLKANKDGDYEIVGHRRTSVLDLPKVFAHKLKEHIIALFPKDTGPLMKAMLTGDKSDLYDNDAQYVALRLAGLSHIIAVSGMHVSFIISLISLAGGRRRITAFLGIPMVWFFAAMTGFGPSVVRASLMISLMLFAPLLRRENDPPTSLSAALLILLIINPQSIGSVSLQLSFAAMAGIILVTPSVYRSYLSIININIPIISSLFRSIGMVFSASVGAMIFTMPLAAVHFGYITLYSIAANILCLWAFSLAFMLAFPVLIIGAIYFPLGKILAVIISALPRYALFVAKIISRLPYSLIITDKIIFALWLVFVYAVFLLSWLLRGKKAYRPIIPLCCCIISLILACFCDNFSSAKETSVTALDVGQGQCIVATTENASVVIDCGGTGIPGNSGDRAAEYLLSSGRRTVDLLILTHLHDDHANGVIRLMNYLDVKGIVLSDDCEHTEIGDNILKTCYDRNVNVFCITENTSYVIDDLIVNIFAPIGSSNANESGLIILGDYGEFEFLVTGDAGVSTEEQLVGMYDLGDIELLVAGHHGSKYSTGRKLLDATTPEMAFISVGINSYGHPAGEVITALNERGVEVWRTDIQGNISATVGKSDG